MISRDHSPCLTSLTSLRDNYSESERDILCVGFNSPGYNWAIVGLKLAFRSPFPAVSILCGSAWGTATKAEQFNAASNSSINISSKLKNLRMLREALYHSLFQVLTRERQSTKTFSNFNCEVKEKGP